MVAASHNSCLFSSEIYSIKLINMLWPHYRIRLHFNVPDVLQPVLDDNRLSANTDKCEFIQIGTYQALRNVSEIHIHINNEPLNQVSVSKYLAMFMGESLKWDHHIDSIIKKGSAKIDMLTSIHKVVPTDTLRLLYNTMVQPHFDYANVVHETSSVTNKVGLQMSPDQSSQSDYCYATSGILH